MTPHRSEASDARRLLLETVRRQPANLPSLSAQVDPALFTRLAERHRVLGRSFRVLGEAGLLPDPLLEDWNDHVTQARVSRMRAHRSLLALSEGIGVPFLVTKGPVLAARWYEVPDDREYNDVDVLVDRVHFTEVLTALESLGAETLLKNWSGFLDRRVAQVPMRLHGSDIDLHWDLVAFGGQRRNVHPDVSDLFERSRPVDLSSEVTVRTLDDVDTLIHLCVNQGLDGARKLRGLMDVDRVVARGIDPDELAERAGRAGSRALCAAVLQRAESLLHTELPAGLLASLEPWPGWTLISRAVDRAPRSARSIEHGGIAAGILVAAGRDTPAVTARTAVRTTADALATRIGRPARTDPGGPLSWQRESPPGARDRYLDWVRSDLQRTECHDVEVLRRALEPYEPRTSPHLGAALLHGLGRRAHADLWQRPDGTIAGVLVTYRWSLGRATGYPAVLDDAAARPMAEFIDRSGITDLAAFDTDLDPLRPYVQRWLASTTATAAVIQPDFTWDDELPTTRRATPDDVDVVTDLMWKFSPQAFPTRWQLRRRVREAVDHLVIVVEHEGQVVGLAARDSATPTYHCWAHMVIHPDFRGEGYSWHLVAAGGAAAHHDGTGAVVFVVASNPMPIPADSKWPDTWRIVELRPPRRFRGEPRLRRATEAAVVALARRGSGPFVESYREPGRADGLVSSRRTRPE